MAATLTGAGDLLYASFPIDKVETDADGDLIVYGKASDGSIDSDQQIVDPSWMASAAQAWKESGANLRVQHNPQRDPAGIGLEVETDSSGATWVKGLVVEPVAKKLVAKGALRAYSVGIARPTIERDAMARGGRITSGELVEISLVDRPANKRCGIQLVKAADDGTPEYVGKVFGADDAIAKALNGDLAEKAVAPAEPAGIDSWAPPADLDISFTPNDLMRMVQNKIIGRHYDELALKAVIETEAAVYKRDIDTAARRRLAADGKALPNLSYPIENAGDLSNAAHLARTGHGDVAAARRLIARRARELGVANPLDESDGANKGASEAEAALLNAAVQTVMPAEDALKETEPEVTKDPEPEPKDAPVKKGKKKPKGGKKLPPWLNKPKDDDGDSDDDGSAEKCHTDPAQAAGVPASPMDPAPVGELMETPAPASCKGGPAPQSASGASEAAAMQPAPAHREPDGAPAEAFEKDARLSDGDHEVPARLEAAMKGASPEVAALLRFQHAGIDPEAGRLHDLTCPAYHPEDVARHHPFADFATAVDLGSFQRKAVQAAAGPDLGRAKAMQQVWQAATSLKAADPAWLNDCRLAAYKAFRDANPGPASFPTPGAISPQRYSRPLVTEGHEASSPGHSGPNTSPQVATSAPDAHSFDRPPLSAGHQSPSPSHMKASFEYPDGTGRPVQLNYATMEKERARQALVQVHEHLSRQFPEACPMSLDGPRQPENHPVPAAVGKSAEEPPVMHTPQGPVPFSLTEGPPAFKAEPEQDDMFADAEVYKSFKKMRKKLGKKVLSGSMTVDEARAKLGRQFAQKGANMVALPLEPSDPSLAPQIPVPTPLAQKSADATDRHVLQPLTVDPAAFAGTFEAAITKAVTPLLERIQQQDQTIGEEKAARAGLVASLAENKRVLDALADQPDPSTAAFSGLAFNPVQKAARPAAVPDIAESAARAQDMIRRNLQSTYYTHSSPAVREAAGQELAKLGWEPSMT